MRASCADKSEASLVCTARGGATCEATRSVLEPLRDVGHAARARRRGHCVAARRCRARAERARPVACQLPARSRGRREGGAAPPECCRLPAGMSCARAPPLASSVMARQRVMMRAPFAHAQCARRSRRCESRSFYCARAKRAHHQSRRCVGAAARRWHAREARAPCRLRATVVPESCCFVCAPPMSARTPNREGVIDSRAARYDARARSARAQPAAAAASDLQQAGSGHVARARSARVSHRRRRIGGAARWWRARAKRARPADVLIFVRGVLGFGRGRQCRRAPAARRDCDVMARWRVVMPSVGQLCRCVWRRGAPPKKIQWIHLDTQKTKFNGYTGYRSLYLSHAKRALYHLSYVPLHFSERFQ